MIAAVAGRVATSPLPCLSGGRRLRARVRYGWADGTSRTRKPAISSSTRIVAV